MASSIRGSTFYLDEEIVALSKFMSSIVLWRAASNLGSDKVPMCTVIVQTQERAEAAAPAARRGLISKLKRP
jgi:hypothetical protein